MKIVAYVNTRRVHWLVESLQMIGVNDIVVTEYFKPMSQISRFELLCDGGDTERIKEIIHRIGTTGYPGDHFLDISDEYH